MVADISNSPFPHQFLPYKWRRNVTLRLVAFSIFPGCTFLCDFLLKVVVLHVL